MIDWNKIRKYEETIKKNKAKLLIETENKLREKLKLKIQIDEIRIRIEKLNYQKKNEITLLWNKSVYEEKKLKYS